MTCHQLLRGAQNTARFTTKRTITMQWRKFTNLPIIANWWRIVPTEWHLNLWISLSKNTPVTNLTITIWVWKSITIRTFWWKPRPEDFLLRDLKTSLVVMATITLRKVQNWRGNQQTSCLSYWWEATGAIRTRHGSTKSPKASLANLKLWFRSRRLI